MKPFRDRGTLPEGTSGLGATRHSTTEFNHDTNEVVPTPYTQVLRSLISKGYSAEDAERALRESITEET